VQSQGQQSQALLWTLWEGPFPPFQLLRLLTSVGVPWRADTSAVPVSIFTRFSPVYLCPNSPVLIKDTRHWVQRQPKLA
jgi:hypothetical protein